MDGRKKAEFLGFFFFHGQKNLELPAKTSPTLSTFNPLLRAKKYSAFVSRGPTGAIGPINLEMEGAQQTVCNNGWSRALLGAFAAKPHSDISYSVVAENVRIDACSEVSVTGSRRPSITCSHH